MNTEQDRSFVDYIACKALPDASTRQNYMFMTRVSFCAEESVYLCQAIYQAIYSLALGVAANFLTDAIRPRMKPDATRSRIVGLLERTEFQNQVVVYRNAIDRLEECLESHPDQRACINYGDPAPLIAKHRSLVAILSDNDIAAPLLTNIVLDYRKRTRFGRSWYLAKYKPDL